VLYLEKTHTTILGRGWLGGTRKHSSYSPVWVEDRAALQDVQVSTMLIADHMPGKLMVTLSESLRMLQTNQGTGTLRILSSATSVSAPPRNVDV